MVWTRKRSEWIGKKTMSEWIGHENDVRMDWTRKYQNGLDKTMSEWIRYEMSEYIRHESYFRMD